MPRVVQTIVVDTRREQGIEKEQTMIDGVNRLSQKRMADYLQYRGKCKEMAEALVKKDPRSRLARGFYHCPFWGKQGHWWVVNPDGTIVDPSAAQFPSYGAGEYEEFNGMIQCEECGKEVPEADAYIEGSHAFCCGSCFGRYIGLIK